MSASTQRAKDDTDAENETKKNSKWNFFDFDKFEPTKFRRSLSKTSSVMRYTYRHIFPVLKKIRDNDCKIEDTDIEDIDDGPDPQTSKIKLEEFKKIVERMVKDAEDKGEKPDYY